MPPVKRELQEFYKRVEAAGFLEISRVIQTIPRLADRESESFCVWLFKRLLEGINIRAKCLKGMPLVSGVLSAFETRFY